MKWCHRKCHHKNRNFKISLAEMESGTVGVVHDLCHDRKYRSIIVSLGIQVGVQIEVIRKTYSEQGCMIIKISGNRLIINQKLASKIIMNF